MRAFNTSTPLVVEGVMYLTAGTRIVALDADSGREIWVYEEPRGSELGAVRSSFSGRGLSYWAGDATEGPRLVAMAGNRMVQLDAATGNRVASFGNNGEINVGVPAATAPAIYKNIAVIGASTLENPRRSGRQSTCLRSQNGQESLGIPDRPPRS